MSGMSKLWSSNLIVKMTFRHFRSPCMKVKVWFKYILQVHWMIFPLTSVKNIICSMLISLWIWLTHNHWNRFKMVMNIVVKGSMPMLMNQPWEETHWSVIPWLKNHYITTIKPWMIHSIWGATTIYMTAGSLWAECTKCILHTSIQSSWRSTWTLDFLAVSSKCKEKKVNYK